MCSVELNIAGLTMPVHDGQVASFFLVMAGFESVVWWWCCHHHYHWGMPDSSSLSNDKRLRQIRCTIFFLESSRGLDDEIIALTKLYATLAGKMTSFASCFKHTEGLVCTSSASRNDEVSLFQHFMYILSLLFRGVRSSRHDPLAGYFTISNAVVWHFGEWRCLSFSWRKWS
jgi:hypothetical protein